VAHLNLARWFHVPDIVFDDGLLPGKPAPDTYLRPAQNLCLKPGDCIVVEDAYSGIQAAREAGIGRIIAIGPASTHDRLREIDGVDDVIESLNHIPKEGLFPGPAT
jgi:beta-phosphoglucomutase-like phosphatase (HAD superfamily)